MGAAILALCVLARILTPAPFAFAAPPSASPGVAPADLGDPLRPRVRNELYDGPGGQPAFAADLELLNGDSLTVYQPLFPVQLSPDKRYAAFSHYRGASGLFLAELEEGGVRELGWLRRVGAYEFGDFAWSADGRLVAVTACNHLVFPAAARLLIAEARPGRLWTADIGPSRTVRPDCRPYELAWSSPPAHLGIVDLPEAYDERPGLTVLRADGLVLATFALKPRFKELLWEDEHSLVAWNEDGTNQTILIGKPGGGGAPPGGKDGRLRRKASPAQVTISTVPYIKEATAAPSGAPRPEGPAPAPAFRPLPARHVYRAYVRVAGGQKVLLESYFPLRRSPDQRLVATNLHKGKVGIFLVDARDGVVQAPFVLRPGGEILSESHWSTDSRRAAAVVSDLGDASTRVRLVLVDVASGGMVQFPLANLARVVGWSPDGARFAVVETFPEMRKASILVLEADGRALHLSADAAIYAISSAKVAWLDPGALSVRTGGTTNLVFALRSGAPCRRGLDDAPAPCK